MTDKLREAAQMALDALEYPGPSWPDARQKAAEALRAALAQPEQEEDYDAIANKQLASLKAAAKVTFEDAVVRAVHKLYTAPPQREWQGLTDEEAKKTFEAHNCTISADLAGILARAIEAKLKEKNYGTL